MTSRNTALDGLRGWAALIVIVYHSLLLVDESLVELVLHTPIFELHTFSDVANKILLSVFNGATAVSLFFVLSGTVLKISLDRRRETHSLLGTSSTFVTSRLLRLYPTLMVAVAFMFVLSRVGIPRYPQFTITQFFDNFFMIHPTLIGASATIQVELFAIPLVLIVWLLYRKLGFPILVIAYVITLAFHDHAWLAPFAQVGVYFGAFVLGMMAADSRAKAFFGNIGGGIAVLVLALLLVVRMLQNGRVASTEIEITLLCALLVAIVLWSVKLGALGAFLHSRISQFLGHISYSLYLLNVPLLALFMGLFPLPQLGLHGILTGFIIALCTIVVTIPLAWLSARYVEMPSIRAGKAVSRFIFRFTEKPRTPSHLS